MPSALDTPVVFMVFNRPALTERVLRQIRRQRPRRLWVISDGPRADSPSDLRQVARVRAAIDRLVDWPCELTRDYADKNLGCGPRIASGLTSAFDRFDRAIVLEDDTLPDPSFFRFCETMLDRYANDPRVVHVSGANSTAALGLSQPQDAYRFSRIPDIWGWATWSRDWSHYDFRLSEWDTIDQADWLRSITPHRPIRKLLRGAFNQQFRLGNNPRSWDPSWVYACLRRGLSVTPMRNLVSNVGFGRQSTNCELAAHPLASLPTQPIDTQRLLAPPVEADPQLDDQLLRTRFEGDQAIARASLVRRLRIDRAARSLLSGLLAPGRGLAVRPHVRADAIG